MVVQLLLRSVAADPTAPPVSRRQLSAACAHSGEAFTAELDVAVPAGMKLIEITMLGHQRAAHV